MKSKILSYLFLVFMTMSKSYGQCYIDSEIQSNRIKSAVITSAQQDLPKELYSEIQIIFTYLNSQYGTHIKYYYINKDNAYFSPYDKNIYVGIPLIKEIYENSGMGGVAFVLCHEFGHYGQDLFSNNNRQANGSHRVNELQADCTAAYLLGRIIDKKIIPYEERNDLMSILEGIFKSGDRGFTSIDHHGTHMERTLTAFFAPGSILGDNYDRSLREIFSITNKWYTSQGIVPCEVNPLNKTYKSISSFGMLFNKNTGEYSTIGLDFNLYLYAIKSADGKTKLTNGCNAIGKLNIGRFEKMNANDPGGIGFYIQMENAKSNSYETEFFVYKNAVYSDQSMTKKIPSLYWNTEMPVPTSF